MVRGLCLYCNPRDTARLRIDREHRAIDHLLERIGLPADTIERHHAPTVGDLVKYLARTRYEVVQISAHGDVGSITIDDDSGTGHLNIEAGRLAELVRRSQPDLRAALFMSCYSGETVDALRPSAPYVVVVEGPADDNLAIRFVESFFESYLQDGSVERAFASAQMTVTLLEGFESPPLLEARLLRREAPVDDWTVEAVVDGDTLLIRYDDAADDLVRLGIEPRAFATSLARKMRVHRWMFETPREELILPIGGYLGRFTWHNARDVIRCTAAYALRDDLSRADCNFLFSVIVLYNDLSNSAYRHLASPASPENTGHLEQAVTKVRRARGFLSTTEVESSLSGMLVGAHRAGLAAFEAHARMAEEKLSNEEFGDVVFYLEASLTTLHDLVNDCVSSCSQ